MAPLSLRLLSQLPSERKLHGALSRQWRQKLPALLLAQQRATSRALETEVQALEVRNAQLEARCKSYLDERRAMI